MRYVIATVVSVILLALGWMGSRHVMFLAQGWADAEAPLTAGQQLLFAASAWFIRLFPLLLLLLPALGVLLVRITLPATPEQR